MLTENEKSQIHTLLKTFFSTSDAGNYFLSLLALRGNETAAMQRFSEGVSNMIVKMVEDCVDESEVEKKLFKISKSYTDFLPTLNELGGLPKMIASTDRQLMQMGINGMQVLAQYYGLKEILIVHFGNTKIKMLHDTFVK